jgi:hypothetical protein
MQNRLPMTRLIVLSVFLVATAAADECPPFAGNIIDDALRRIHGVMELPSETTREDGLACVIRRLGGHDDAEAAALHAHASMQLAQLQAQAGRPDSARRALLAVRADTPYSRDALLMLAEIDAARGNRDAAIRWYLLAAEQLANEPSSGEAVLAAAALAATSSGYDAGRPAQALELLDRLLDRSVVALQEITGLRAQLRDAPDFSPQALAASPLLRRHAARLLVDPAFTTLAQESGRLAEQSPVLERQAAVAADRIRERAQLLDKLDSSLGALEQRRRQVLAQTTRDRSAWAQAIEDARGCTEPDCAARIAARDAIGRAVTRQRNELARLDVRMAAMGRSQQVLQAEVPTDPEAVRDLARQAAALSEQGREELRAQLDAALAAAHSAWRNTAGAAADYRAQVMEGEVRRR